MIMTCHSRSANCIRLVFAAVAAVLWMPPAHAVTEDQIIDDVAVLVNPVNTADIQAELEELIGGLVADTSDYNGLAFQWNNSLPVLMWFRGRVTSTLAPLIPLMPGEVSNAATLRGSLACGGKYRTFSCNKGSGSLNSTTRTPPSTTLNSPTRTLATGTTGF